MLNDFKPDRSALPAMPLTFVSNFNPDAFILFHAHIYLSTALAVWSCVFETNMLINFCCRKESSNWGHVARSRNEDIMTTQCEAYELTKLGHEYEDLSVYQNLEYEIPIGGHSADVPTRNSGEWIQIITCVINFYVVACSMQWVWCIKVLFIHKSVSPITVLAQLNFQATQEDEIFSTLYASCEQGSLVLCTLQYLIYLP